MTQTVTFQFHGRTRTLRGQEARTLLELYRAGSHGVTAAEMSSWALRLAAYVMRLRRIGLEIETIREPHKGGWHGRYVLHTAVKPLTTLDRAEALVP